jgi:hypothetical protein
VASDGAIADHFGTSVAVQGDTMVVGAPGADVAVGGSARGAVYVFTLSGSTWTQTAKLTASDGADGDHLGTSVDIDGDKIVAGAEGDDSEAGSAYIFNRTGSPTTQVAKLTASDRHSLDALGTAVAIDGDTIVAGAPGKNSSMAIGSQEGQGAVYTFASSCVSACTQTAKLTATEGLTDVGFDFGGDFLGASVDIDGDSIVAGAPRDTQEAAGSNNRKGALFTFTRTGASTRTETAKLTVTPPQDGNLGDSVAINQNTIVGGDEQADSAFGAAYTFAATGAATRNQTAKLTPTNGHQNNIFGKSVAIDSRSIIVGAPEEPPGVTAHGTSFRFARTGGDRHETDFAGPASNGGDPEYGYSVATDGGWVILGAPYDDTAAADAGAANAVKLPDYAPVDESPSGNPPTDNPPTDNPPTTNPPTGGGGDNAACDKAKAKLKKAKDKLKKLRQQDASKDQIDKAKDKVKKAKQRVKDAC